MYTCPPASIFATTCNYIGIDATGATAAAASASHGMMYQCYKSDKIFATQKTVRQQSQHISFSILVKPGSQQLNSQLGRRRAGGPGGPVNSKSDSLTGTWHPPVAKISKDVAATIRSSWLHQKEELAQANKAAIQTRQLLLQRRAGARAILKTAMKK